MIFTRVLGLEFISSWVDDLSQVYILLKLNCIDSPSGIYENSELLANQRKCTPLTACTQRTWGDQPFSDSADLPNSGCQLPKSNGWETQEIGGEVGFPFGWF